jgi:hypothetical protein
MTEEEKKEKRREACRRWRVEHPGYGTAYYKIHKEKMKAQARAFHRKNIHENREKGRIRKKRCRQRDPEKYRKIARCYRNAHRDAENARTERWRNENRQYNRLLSRAWYHENRERNILRMRRYYRKNRKVLLESKRRWYQDNPLSVEAIKNKNKKRYKENPNTFLIRCREWARRNPEKIMEILKRRRAKKLGAAICNLTNKQWDEIKSAYEMRCAYCGHRFERLTQDHVIPLSKGGNHTKDNVVPACRPCNSKKRDRPHPPFVVYPLTKDQA